MFLALILPTAEASWLCGADFTPLTEPKVIKSLRAVSEPIPGILVSSVALM